MYIAKAIEILSSYKAGSYEDTGPDLDDALDLGIDALKFIEENRGQGAGSVPRLLPGETEPGEGGNR